MASSSSWHTLNADRRLAHRVWPIWFLCNLINNRRSSKFSGLTIKKFRPTSLRDDWTGSENTASPSRRLIDLFFADLPFEQIAERLGGIHILDLGCGVGKYAKMFQELYGAQVDFSYLGVDQKISATWHDHSGHHCSFRKAGVGDIDLSLLEPANVIVSITVLEHLDHDLLLFQKISELQRSLGRQFLQIHFVPSAACLWLYGLHGVRQYTPRTIAKIADAVGIDTKVIAYALGGKHSNWAHWRNITFPLKARLGDRRFIDTDRYCRDRSEAIAADSSDRIDAPSFYAILILPDQIQELEI